MLLFVMNVQISEGNKRELSLKNDYDLFSRETKFLLSMVDALKEVYTSTHISKNWGT